MIERLLIWILDTFYPKQEEPPKPTVSVSVNQKQTVSKSTVKATPTRPKSTPAKGVVAAKKAVKKVKK